jgi:hypothetical protein
MQEITHNLLIRERENTQKLINSILESEQGYIFTNDYSFFSKKGKASNKDGDMDPD